MRASFRNGLYLFSLLPAVVVICGNLNGGFFTVSNILFSLVFLGILEWLTPELRSNLHSSKEDTLPLFIIWLHVPFQLCALASLFYAIRMDTIGGYWILWASLSTGLNTATSAIVVAHELIHRKRKFEQGLGKLLLFTSGNVYFYIEHLRVHHKWVGTEKDHATARYGESLYRFFMRSAAGQIKGALKLEADRLKAKKASPYSLHNYVVRQIVLQVCVLVAIALILGPMVLLAWVVQCFLSNFLLEYVNYIQHYGLTRHEQTRTTEEYSWDSDKFFSRFVLIDLSRHADHHYYASKPYHTLIRYDLSPKLPSGYAGLFPIALIPPAWRKLIHPLLPAQP